mmetsp:Transcript_46947/g.134256  ORF Transcript_46947/g.134256 Transcript_46947/m.134256 type:complete len:483 (-) Transcript_46947:213-1661(-)
MSVMGGPAWTWKGRRAEEPPDQLLLSVKNTFLEMRSIAAVARRAASLPPVLVDGAVPPSGLTTSLAKNPADDDEVLSRCSTVGGAGSIDADADSLGCSGGSLSRGPGSVETPSRASSDVVEDTLPSCIDEATTAACGSMQGAPPAVESGPAWGRQAPMCVGAGVPLMAMAYFPALLPAGGGAPISFLPGCGFRQSGNVVGMAGFRRYGEQASASTAAAGHGHGQQSSLGAFAGWGRAPDAGRSKLSSSAAAWTPGGGLRAGAAPAPALAPTRPLPVSLAAACRADLECLAGRVARDLRNTGWVTGTAVAWQREESGSAECLTVVAELPSEHFHRRDAVFSRAQASMLRGADTDQLRVGLLARARAPFLREDWGFSATLVDQEDKGLCCWDAYETGACCRGASCRWQHPRWQRRLRLMLRLADRAAADATHDLVQPATERCRGVDRGAPELGRHCTGGEKDAEGRLEDAAGFVDGLMDYLLAR